MRPTWNHALGTAALACLALCWVVSPAAGEEAEEPAAAAVPLEKLLKLPPGAVQGSAQRYGGATRGEWQSRFGELRTQLAEARAALLAAQTELGELAAETQQWQMTAPGLGGIQGASDNGPLNYRLHQEIRRQREEIARSEARLTELRVEANLAGVPKEWIDPPQAETLPGSPPPGS